MNPDLVVALLTSAMQVALTVAAPMLIFGLTVGLMVSIFQAVTQIQEMTLAFVPKIFAIMIALAVFFPWMMQIVMVFSTNLLQNINVYIGKG
jgi:flagellar biosynthetic protein FliQ